LDTKISPPYPKSWSASVFTKTPSEAIESLAEREIVEYSMKEDHIHMTIFISAKYGVVDSIYKLKELKESDLRKEGSCLAKVY
jgi:REP element-mobilizing transposase RayT